ncbi:MAG: hypothetical protein NVSMB21_23650 [Vulcanimicrobiaceae bacterium]
MFDRSVLKATLSVASLAAFVLTALAPARAASHLPTISIDPTAIFITSGDVHPSPGVAPADGNIVLNGTITFPVAAGVSASYDHFTNGLFYYTIPRIAAPNGGYNNNPLDYRDVFDTFRIDAPLFKGVGAELGSAYRHRVCCPADSDPRNTTPIFYHDNYLGLSYTSPAIAALHGTRFIYGITGHASPHNSDNAAAAAASVALGFREKRTLYGITQAFTAAVPVDPANGFSVAGTYAFGAFNYFSNLAYPLQYGVVIVNATKRINKYANFVVNVDNFVQRRQGYPLGPADGGGLVGASINVGLDLHYGP